MAAITSRSLGSGPRVLDFFCPFFHMRPSQLSAALRQIASRIDASRNPSRELVAKDLRRVVAVMGLGIMLDEESGGYLFDMEEVYTDRDRVQYEVSGTDSSGKPFKGLFTAHLTVDGGDVSVTGWDWDCKEGDLPAEADAVQPILDSIGEEVEQFNPAATSR